MLAWVIAHRLSFLAWRVAITTSYSVEVFTIFLVDLVLFVDEKVIDYGCIGHHVQD
jgi:hypothetical protein